MEFNAATSVSQNYEISMKIDERQEAGLTTDSATFFPFVLIDGQCRALVMFDDCMASKCHVFAEHSRDGWTGSGNDWTVLAQVIVAQQLSARAEPVTYDSDADMFSARGSRSTLEELGFALQAVFRKDQAIRDLMSHATLPLLNWSARNRYLLE